MALKHLILPLCLVSFQACGAQDSTSRPSLQELKEQYGKTAHAYELHTVGMGLGEAEITPTDPVLVDSELEKVVITYHPP